MDATADSPSPGRSPRTRGRAMRELLLVSVSLTILAAVVAVPVSAAIGERWSLVFVLARWVCIFALLATPVVQQVAHRSGARWQLPWAMRTPATALLLTCESVTLDILSAASH